MRDLLKSAFALLRDHAAGAAFAALSTAFAGFSAYTAHRFWYLFGKEPLATAALCGSFVVLGLVAGSALCWLVLRYGSAGRTRRMVRRLPRNQKAILGIALDASGVATMWDHEKDIEYLDSVGLIKSFSNAWVKEFTATDDARRVVGGRLRSELVAAGKEMLAEDRRAEVERKAGELAKTDPHMRDVLFKVISAKSEGLIVPVTDHWSSYETRNMNEVLEELRRLGMCDFDMHSTGRKWVPTDLLLEIWEGYPSLFTNY